jgi:hypothetical protein
LVSARSGVADTVSVSFPVLFAGVGSAPFAASSATDAVFTRLSAPASTVETTFTAKLTVADAPTARLPIVNVQVVPAALPSAQDQPAVLDPITNVVAAGTVSVNVTPVASCVPLFMYVRP